MSLKIIVGGQFGGEGKGKTTYCFAKEQNIKYTVRVGGSNSGHTVVHNDRKYIFRHLPTTCLLENCVSILAAGTYIDLDILKSEIEIAKIEVNNLKIDPNAVVVINEDKIEEKENGYKENIGSTLSGTGASVLRRISRDGTTQLAKDCEFLKPYITDTKQYLREKLNENSDILIEGTQGYGLSLLHTPYYPYATSRDTTAAGFLSEVGLSPFDVDEIILVIRTYPIRVEGSSGPLPFEIKWSDIDTKEEYTSVTQGVRRVAKFDSEIVKQAIIANRPSKVVLNHLDYIDKNDREQFITEVEKSIGQKVDLVGLSDNELEVR
jgi:adenylosuccinate synthase